MQERHQRLCTHCDLKEAEDQTLQNFFRNVLNIFNLEKNPSFLSLDGDRASLWTGESERGEERKREKKREIERERERERELRAFQKKRTLIK